MHICINLLYLGDSRWSTTDCQKSCYNYIVVHCGDCSASDGACSGNHWRHYRHLVFSCLLHDWSMLRWLRRYLLLPTIFLSKSGQYTFINVCNVHVWHIMQWCACPMRSHTCLNRQCLCVIYKMYYGLEWSPGCTASDARGPLCSIPLWPYDHIVWPRLGWERFWVDYLEGALYKTAVIRIFNNWGLLIVIHVQYVHVCIVVDCLTLVLQISDRYLITLSLVYCSHNYAVAFLVK